MQTVVITTTVYTQKTLCDPRPRSLFVFYLFRISASHVLHLRADYTCTWDMMHLQKIAQRPWNSCISTVKHVVATPIPYLSFERSASRAAAAASAAAAAPPVSILCSCMCTHPPPENEGFSFSFVRIVFALYSPKLSTQRKRLRAKLSEICKCSKADTHKTKNGPRRKSNYVGQFITEDNQNLEEALQALHIDSQTCRPPFVLPERAAARLPAGVVGILAGSVDTRCC